MKYLFLLAIFSLTTILHAESFTQVSKINGLTSGGNYVRVALDNMQEAEGCKNQNYYLLDVSKEISNIMFQLLLAAKSSNQKISIQIDGCKALEDREYPLITHVYFCDSQYCN